VTWRLTPADYQSVRKAIDISLSEGSLPDDIIALPIYSGYAEQKVLSTVPDADTAGAARQAHLHTAAILYTAAALVYAIPNFVREQGPEFAAVVERVKPEQLAGDLRLRADAELQAGAVDPDLSLVPLIFTVARGDRGKW
jgi:hypothetical protein